jgi:hypothetical protein
MIPRAARGGTGYERSSGMNAKDLPDEKLRIMLCMVVATPALAAVPFVGTRFGDFPEFVALAIGVAPILYLVFFAMFNLNRRLGDLEKRK